MGQANKGGKTKSRTTDLAGEHICAYHGTGFSTVNRTHLGVRVLDVTDPTNPTPTGLPDHHFDARSLGSPLKGQRAPPVTRCK